MAVSKRYFCDLCEAEGENLIGLSWRGPLGYVQVSDWPEATTHLCPVCLSSLQQLAPRCGAGYECNGGPDCGSDHK